MVDTPEDDGMTPDERPKEAYKPPEAPKPVRAVAEVIAELGRPLTPQELLGLLDEGEVFEAITAGVSQRSLARAAGVSVRALREWLAAPERSARAIKARQDAAQAFDELAEHVLLTAPANPVELARARELASHYRWRAKVVNPAAYGDKVQATVTHDVAAELRDFVHQRGSRLPLAERIDDIRNEEQSSANSLSALTIPAAALTGRHSLDPDSGPVP